MLLQEPDILTSVIPSYSSDTQSKSHVTQAVHKLYVNLMKTF